MQETIARPYSTAIFELAKNNDSLLEWSDFLFNIKLIVENSKIQDIVENPRYSVEDLQNLLLSILKKVEKQQKNLINLLIKNKRLSALPHIYQQFEDLKNKYENITEAEVVSAFPMDKTEIDEITKLLENKFGGSIKIKENIDKKLLGGLIIRVGDTVINTSLLNKINQFANKII